MNSHLEPSAEPSREKVWTMFDRIAPRYDLLNRLLSFRQDVLWRNRMAKMMPPGQSLAVLDIATGTADQLFSILAKCDRVERGIGIDMSEGMLDVGRKKIAARGKSDILELKTGDAMAIPFPDASFDAATISFGIRNVMDVPGALKEIRRVLKPGGRALILEFSLPRSKAFRALYLFYLRRILPVLGGIISGDSYAYRYLNQTIETFPYGDAFCALMKDAGFATAKAHPQTFGIASIYEGNCDQP